MTSRDFCYWLQGYLEINGHATKQVPAQRLAMDANQVECVQRHLAMVFKHEIDPSFPNAEALNQLHKPGPLRPDLIVRC